MRKTILIIIALIAVSCELLASSETKYRKYASEIELQVWNMDLPQFRNSTIPEKYRDAKAVILAEYDSIEYRRVQRFAPFLGCALPIPVFWKEIFTRHLHRTRIFINSEEAAREFATVTYSRKDDQTFSFGILGFTDRTVMGIRVIKPDGNMYTVDTTPYFKPRDVYNSVWEDITDTIHIDHLEPGDILDIFKHQRLWKEKSPYFFSPSAAYPTLHYDCRVRSDRHLNLQYRQMNGAPDFVVHSDEKSYVLTASLQDYSDTTALQPRIAVYARKAKQPYKYQGIIANPDIATVTANPWYERVCKRHQLIRNPAEFWFGPDSLKHKESIDQIASSDLHPSKKTDSLYAYLCRIETEKPTGYAPKYYLPTDYLDVFAYALYQSNIPFDFALTTKPDKEPIDQLMDIGNIVWFIRLKDGKCYFPNQKTLAGEVPATLRGRRAVLDDWQTYFDL